MSSIIKTLKDKLSNTIYPQTLTRAVYDDNNNRLDQILAQCMDADIIAPIELSEISAHEYVEDDYLLYNGFLYKVLTNIDIGDTINPGTGGNVVQTLVSAEIGGSGVPDGGTAGQIIVKNSSDKGDASWTSLDSTPTSGSTNAITSGAVYMGLAGKQDTLTFDSAPTENSNNPVTSDGLYTAFSGVTTSLAGKQDTLTFDNSPTENSDNPVKSGGLYTALAGKQSSLTFDNAPTANSDNPVKSGGIKTALDEKAVVTITTTDPGEGSPLAANTLLIVVEE